MRYDQADTDQELEESTNRVMQIGAVLLLLMAAVFPLYRWFEPANRESAREEHLASLAQSGEQMWNTNCASCHGRAGEGVSAPALNSKQFQQSAAEDQIANFIAVGVPGTAMSAYSQDYAGPLTSEQIRAITVFIRTWEDGAPDRPDWRAPFESAAG